MMGENKEIIEAMRQARDAHIAEHGRSKPELIYSSPWEMAVFVDAVLSVINAQAERIAKLEAAVNGAPELLDAAADDHTEVLRQTAPLKAVRDTHADTIRAKAQALRDATSPDIKSSIADYVNRSAAVNSMYTGDIAAWFSRNDEAIRGNVDPDGDGSGDAECPVCGGDGGWWEDDNGNWSESSDYMGDQVRVKCGSCEGKG